MTNAELQKIYYAGGSVKITEMLEEELKSLSIAKLANKLDTTYNNVRNTCRRLNIKGGGKL